MLCAVKPERKGEGSKRQKSEERESCVLFAVCLAVVKRFRAEAFRAEAFQRLDNLLEDRRWRTS
jgi:hypothetical protein